MVALCKIRTQFPPFSTPLLCIICMILKQQYPNYLLAVFTILVEQFYTRTRFRYITTHVLTKSQVTSILRRHNYYNKLSEVSRKVRSEASSPNALELIIMIYQSLPSPSPSLSMLLIYYLKMKQQINDHGCVAA